LALVVVSTALNAPPRAAAPNWHVTATVDESCSCTIFCSCNFDGGSTREKAGTATTLAAGDATATTTDVIGADKGRV